MENGRGKRIGSLQALRAIAFLGIFLNHAGLKFNWSELGVSVFFVLSGFLMTRGRSASDYPLSPLKSLTSAVKRIAKLYPLHILTMLIMFALQLVWVGGFSNIKGTGLVKELLLNSVLMQSWYPNSAVCVSLNGVAWYLSTTLFLYFVFPYLLWAAEKMKPYLRWALLVFMLMLQLVFAFDVVRKLGTENNLYIWFMYMFPIFRIPDIYAGICLGKSSSLSAEPSGDDKPKQTVMEVLAFIITMAVCLWRHTDPYKSVNAALRNWTTVYIPMAVVWVCLFTRRGGYLTGLLDNKLLKLVGDLSAYAFLIHFALIKCVGTFMRSAGIKATGVWKAPVVIAELLLSLLLSYLWKRIFDVKKKGVKEKT